MERMTPFLKETIWAGEKLGGGIGEAYLFSALAERSSVSETGERLADIVSEEVPLIKYIDAAGALSVQVHPKGNNGKDELWIIDDVYDDAAVYIGFCRAVSKDDVISAIKNGTLFSLMQRVAVSPGDVLWIPGGTIHAAKGISFFEIQHSRDITYRLYDYGRGREIQWAEGFGVLDLAPVHFKRSWLYALALPGFLKRTPFSFRPLILHGVYCQRAENDLAVVVMKGHGCLNGKPFQKRDCFFVRRGEFLSFFGESTLFLADASISLGKI